MPPAFASTRRLLAFLSRESVLLLAPWILAPAALYVALLPLLTTTISLRRVALTGVLGALFVVAPAVAVARAEARRGRRPAAAVLVVAAGAACVALASGAGVPGAFALCALFQIAACGYGGTLGVRLGLLEETDMWAAAPLSLALGWVALIVIGLVAGLAAVLTAPVVAGVLLVGIALAVRTARRIRAASAPRAARVPASSPDETPPMVWWWGLAVLLLVGFVGAVAPEIRHDALTAHLPTAREFATRGAIVEIRHNSASYFQQNADLMYAMGMVLSPGEALPKLLHWSAGAAAALVVYDLGARLWTPRVGLAAAAITAGTPLAWWVGGSAYTDLWVVLFAAAMLGALVLYARCPGAGRALAVGLFAGAVMGTKITGITIVAPGAAALLIWIARSRRPRWPAAAAFLAGGIVSGVFWFARAYVLTGNPVFPLGARFFRSLVGADDPGAVAQLFGMGGGPLDLLLLPWRVTRFPQRFVEDGGIGIVYFVLLPVALLAIARGQVPRWFVALFVTAGVLWAFTAQYLRYLLPVLPLAALMAAAGAVGAPARRATASGLLVLALGLALGTGTWAAPGSPNFPIGVAIRRVTRDAYRWNFVPGYAVGRFAREALPASARIVGIGEDRAFLYEGFFVPASWYGRRYDRRLPELGIAAATGAEIEREVAGAGFTHFVLNTDRMAFVRRSRPESWIVREALWGEGPRLEYADGGCYLFSVLNPQGPRTAGAPLLAEESEVRHSTITELPRVRAEPGALYGLEAEIRADGPGAVVHLSIQWADAAGRHIETGTRRWVRAEPAWRRVAIAATAPPDAATAVVKVGAVRADPVVIRSLRMVELR